VIKALEIVSEEKAIGRMKLSEELELGEGVTRTLVKHLKKEGIIEVSNYGIVLSDHGKKLFSDLKSKISVGVEVPPTPLTVGHFNVAVLVRDIAQRVKRGLEQRDMAIKAGALGRQPSFFSATD
jgi:predicted transcriptional regulator